MKNTNKKNDKKKPKTSLKLTEVLNLKSKVIDIFDWKLIEASRVAKTLITTSAKASNCLPILAVNRSNHCDRVANESADLLQLLSIRKFRISTKNEVLFFHRCMKLHDAYKYYPDSKTNDHGHRAAILIEAVYPVDIITADGDMSKTFYYDVINAVRFHSVKEDLKISSDELQLIAIICDVIDHLEPEYLDIVYHNVTKIAMNTTFNGYLKKQMGKVKELQFALMENKVISNELRLFLIQYIDKQLTKKQNMIREYFK